MRARLPANRKKDESEQTKRTRVNAVRIDKKAKKTRTANNDTRKMKSPEKNVRPLPGKVEEPFKEENSDTERSTFETNFVQTLYKSSESIDSVPKYPPLRSSDSVEELTAEKKSVSPPRQTEKKVDRSGEIEATKSEVSSMSEEGEEAKRTAGNTDDKQQMTDTTADKESERITADLIIEVNTMMHEGNGEKKLKENAEDSEVVSDDESEKYGKSTAEHSFSEFDDTIGQMETQT